MLTAIHDRHHGKELTVADNRNQTGLDTAPSVSALGLRWAALRGMLASPLIEADEQRGLREELLRELQAIEQDFAALPARTAVEISAKIDVAKTVLRDSATDRPHWLVDLLDSVQSDLRSIAASAPAARPTGHLSRTFQARPEPAPAQAPPAASPNEGGPLE
jgi:hypothetical protein